MPVSSVSAPTSVGSSPAPGARLARFLRRRHPAKTCAHVAAETGASLAAVERMLERESLPSFATLGRMLAAYGPELLVETLDNPPEWLRRAVEASGEAARSPCGAVRAEMATRDRAAEASREAAEKAE